MSKISALPVLLAADGSEALPVIHAGQTYRQTTASLMAPHVANAADSAAAAQALVNFRPTFAAAVADFPAGASFACSESGELRLYQRTADAPGYVDLGDAVAPVAVPDLAAINGTAFSGFGGRRIKPSVMTLRTSGYAVAGDGGLATYRRTAAEPTHAAKVRSADRFLPDGTTSADNGGWWELDEPVVYITMFGASTGSADNTAAINAASAYVSAKGGGSVIVPAGTFMVRTDASNFLILRPNVIFRNAASRPEKFDNIVSVIRQTTDSTGFMFRPGAVKPNSCGVIGLTLYGPGAGYATNGSGGIDLRWSPGSIGDPVVYGCNFKYFAEEGLIESSLNGRFFANVASQCLMRRTPRTAYAGAFTIGGIDGIVEDNEVGCSVQADMNMTTPAPYNATPLLAGLYFKGGNTRSRNNRAETSEIGVVNEGGAIRSVTDHAEFNAAWGWLERGSSINTIIAPYFDNNSGIRSAAPNAVGGYDGMYSHLRKETSNPLTISAPTIIRSHNTLWGVSVAALYDVEDAAGGSTTELSGVNAYAIPLRVWSVDGTVRTPAPAVPPRRGENGIANSVGSGAVIGPLGAGGSLPAGWSYTMGAVGVTATVESVAEDASGAKAVVIHFTGTASANTNFVASFAPTNGSPAAQIGDVWTWSVASMVDSLQGTGANNVSIALHEQTATGADVGTPSQLYHALSDRVTRWSRGAPLDCARTSITRTVSGATTRRVKGDIAFQVVAGVVDFRVKIGLPQLERGASMGQPVLTYGSPAIAPEAPGYVAAIAGGTTAMGVRQPLLALDPAAPIAGYTVTLPAAPQPGERVTITTSQAITALTIGGGGYPVIGAPGALAAGASATFAFEPTSGMWFAV